jgi:hypothetical protein
MTRYFHGLFWEGTIPPLDSTPEEVAAIIAADPAWSFTVDPNNAIRNMMGAAWFAAGRVGGSFWLAVTQELVRIADNPNIPRADEGLAADLAYIVSVYAIPSHG